MFLKLFCIILVATLVLPAVYAVTVVLSPPVIDVIENSSVILTCSSEEKANILQSSWTFLNNNTVALLTLSPDGLCIPSGFINDGNLYDWTCYNNNTFSLTLKHVSRSEHVGMWICAMPFIKSNISTIYVKVPVKTVNITSDKDSQVPTMENANTTLICQTSPSRPIPALSWFLSDPDMKKTINITDASRQSPQAGDSVNLTEVESVLTYRFTREHNGWHVYCQAANIPGRSVNSSTKALLIIYPPDGPPTLTNRHNGDVYNVIEYQQGNMSCSVKGGNPPANLTWQCFNGQVTPAVQNGSVISRNITWRVLRNQHNRSCTCVSEHKTGDLNVSVNVKVLYPPDKPMFSIQTNTLNKTIAIIQNNSLTVNCTSDSNPNPHYVWIKRFDVIENGQTLKIDRTQENDSGEYECRVNNTMIDSDGLTKDGRNSSNITLKILFPPNTPTFNYIGMKEHVISSSLINVIRDDRFTISCRSNGQPIPDYRWGNGAVGNRSSINATESVNKTCIATNTMRETNGVPRTVSASATLYVNVQYQPTMPQIYISNQTGENHTVSEYIQVLEYESFHLLCTSHGRPTPLYTWFRKRETSKEYKLVIKNINRQQSGKYRCQASNTMLRTFGEKENGSSEINTTIDVLYPAEVNILTNKTVAEGDFINISCPVIVGNPPVSKVKWSTTGDLNYMNSSVLYISNISRTDEKVYNCSVTTTMKPTYGLTTKKEHFRHFKLTVNYKARVTNFSVGEETHEHVYTVNEKDNVTFKCEIDSKPAPNATLFVNDRAVFLSKDNHVIYTKNNIQCSDFGSYRCSSINDYNNGRPSSKNITLFVNCSPRRSPFIELKANVTSARNTKVTFSFTALAYPEPGPAGFNWSFINGSKTVPLSNSSNVLVTSSQLQSNLTIKNVTLENYGHFILIITNTAGVFEQNFFLHQNDIMRSETQLKSARNITVAAVVAGIISIVIIAALLVIGGLLYRKRRHKNDTGKLLYANIPFTGNVQNKKTKCEKSKVKETPFEGLQEIDDVPIITKEPVEYYNSQDVLETIDSIKVTELFSYLIGKDEDSFGIDYQKLPTGLEKPCTFARKPENLAMNRYNGIYPYDHSRVKLHGDPDFFINACYIDGYKRTKAYIASLGPTAKTTSDFKTFWQMIWHEQSDIIVMLTNLREPSGMKCEKYWPDHGDSECYGGIIVTGQNIEIFAEYSIRGFSVRKDDESRTVTHLHYTAWPDKKVPEDTISLLEFRQRIRTTPTGSEGPVVVHCSAGIGRTGTLIALDRLIEEGQCEDSVNVYECVLSMREQRVKMVQTLEQYIYIYKALVSALVFDSEIIPLESYEDYMDTASNTTYSYQFKHLQQSVDTESKEEKESRTVNAARTSQNRTGADIPAALGRVFLYLNKKADDSDYINAVYMNVCWVKFYYHHFILRAHHLQE